MADYLVLDENNAVRLSDITRISRESNGKHVNLYLESGDILTKDLDSPVSIQHVFDILELARHSSGFRSPIEIEWDELSERVHAATAKTATADLEE